MMTEERKEEVSWNLAQYMIQEIANLLSNASKHYVNNDVPKCFNYLQAIRLRLSANLSDDEMKSFNDLEISISKVVHKVKRDGFERPSSKDIENMNQVFIDVRTYNDLIMKSLKKYGFLIPAKEDSTQMRA